MNFLKSLIGKLDYSSEKNLFIDGVNSTFKTICAGQKGIDDFSDIHEKEIGDAEFLNHLLKTFAAEKFVKVNVKKFILDSINAIVNDMGFAVDVSNVINFSSSTTQNLRTMTFFNMLMQIFDFMSHYTVLKDTYEVKCRSSKNGVIIGITAPLKRLKVQVQKKYLLGCSHTHFLQLSNIALLAKQNHYVFNILQNSTNLIFKCEPSQPVALTKSK